MTTFKFTNAILLELIVLTMINTHPYSSTEIINKLNRINFRVPKGSFYPSIARLKHQNFIHSQLEEAETKPADKFHYLTNTGSTRLRELRKRLNSINQTISKADKMQN